LLESTLLHESTLLSFTPRPLSTPAEPPEKTP
jgi:hypothetical protein